MARIRGGGPILGRARHGADIRVQRARPMLGQYRNYAPKFSTVDVITDISVASDFTTHQ